MSAPHQRVRIEANPKWIRGMHRGRTIVNSRSSRFVWEVPYYPAWYFPIVDLAASLVPNGEIRRSPSRGNGAGHDLVVDGETIAGGAWLIPDSPVEELRNLVRIDWPALDNWFEEDVEVFVHPRSPDVRVDVLASSRRVKVSIDGITVADSQRARVLFETGLPPRYYLPPTDVRMDLLIPTDTETACPYKGWANYWSVSADGAVHADVAWGYRTPLPESAGIGGLVCFYNERVDLEVDGAPVDRPRTKFS